GGGGASEPPHPANRAAHKSAANARRGPVMIRMSSSYLRPHQRAAAETSPAAGAAIITASAPQRHRQSLLRLRF
ncbi:MAG TPA: hypothetical protein DEA40_03445, partial [Parvularcula sp.]|nr:hypothetical protein [Parvularcula sp.]